MDSPISLTCSASASAEEWTPATAMPRRAQVRAIRQAISPRLAIRIFLNTNKTPASHPEDAELGGLGRQAAGEIQQQRQPAAGLQGINHHVAPGIACKIVGVGEILKRLAGRSHVGLALALGPAGAF